MAAKRKGNLNNSKENLNWKLNVLAAKTGQDTHIEQAKMAALGERQQQGEHSEGTDNSGDQEKYVKEFNELMKRKLETKLFHIRKEIKSGLKKSKALETTKQSRKLRESQEYVASMTDNSTEKHGKSYTAQDVERFQKELDIFKTIDMEQLAEKVLTKFIQKNATLKKDDTISALLSTTTTTPTTADEKKVESSTSTTDNDKLLLSNIEARLLGNKALTEPLKKSINEMELLLLDPEQRKLAKETKRKAAAVTEQRSSSTKRQKPNDKSSSSSSPSGASSLFMDSLGGDDDVDNNNKDQSKNKKNISSADWEDPDFDKYYNGKKASEKANRPGQSQRRRKWEALHGDKAKHLIEGKLSSRDQRELKKQKRLQREASRADKTDNKQGANPIKKKEEENLEEFHPSWQAKRQQQEMMAKALSGQGAGNKIVFDDAD